MEDLGFFPKHGLSVNAIRIMILAIDVAVSKVILDFVIAAKVNHCVNFYWRILQWTARL